MITLLTGIPGSGKSYMAVEHVSRMKDQSKVLHNIEGFKLGISLDQFSLDNNIRKIDVFRKSYHEKNDNLFGWTIIIDEAAELFPKSLRDTDIISFFDYHRHYGIDIFLLTQDVKKVCPDITCLSETHYRAASGASNPFPGILLYQQIVGGEAVSRKFLRKKKSVFNLYKSASDDSSSTLNIGKVYAVIAIIGVIVFFVGMKYWFNSFRPSSPNSVSFTDTQVTSNKPLHLDTNISKTLSNNNQSLNDSFASVLGGHPYPLSSVRDYTGIHYIFFGQIFKREYFPFKVVKTRLGDIALLPPDIYSQVIAYDKSLDVDVSPPPTEKGTPMSKQSENFQVSKL